MASTYGVRLAALDDLPARGQTAKGAQAAAYRCAARLLQKAGGLAQIIAEEEDVEWPELNYRSIDVREYMGRDVAPRDLDGLAAEIRDALLSEDVVVEAAVEVTQADRGLSIAADLVGADGPFSFVLRIFEATGATLRTF